MVRVCTCLYFQREELRSVKGGVSEEDSEEGEEEESDKEGDNEGVGKVRGQEGAESEDQEGRTGSEDGESEELEESEGEYERVDDVVRVSGGCGL